MRVARGGKAIFCLGWMRSAVAPQASARSAYPGGSPVNFAACQLICPTSARSKIRGSNGIPNHSGTTSLLSRGSGNLLEKIIVCRCGRAVCILAAHVEEMRAGRREGPVPEPAAEDEDLPAQQRRGVPVPTGRVLPDHHRRVPPRGTVESAGVSVLSGRCVDLGA